MFFFGVLYVLSFFFVISSIFCQTEKTQTILDEVLKEQESVKGVSSVLLPIDLQAGNVTLKVVPWIGGRIVSMIHKPSGYEWLEGRFETGCYEEYSGSEYRSSGCTEEYQVVRYFNIFCQSISLLSIILYNMRVGISMLRVICKF